MHINNHTLDYKCINKHWCELGSYMSRNIAMMSDKACALNSRSSARCELNILEYFIVNQRDLNTVSQYLNRRKRNLEERCIYG